MASRWPWWSTTVMTTTAANLFILDPPSDTERANKAGLYTTYLACVTQHYPPGQLVYYIEVYICGEDKNQKSCPPTKTDFLSSYNILIEKGRGLKYIAC